MTTRVVLRTLPDKSKTVLLKEIGADPELVKLIIDVDNKIGEIQKRGPGVAAAWGLGCGGVTC